MAQRSAMQEKFGAKVEVTPAPPSEWQAFFITGSSAEHLAGLVRAHGGRPLVGAGNWLLAELAFSRAMALRGQRGVGMVGGVSVDPERLAALRRVTGPAPP
jgi:hypothetical protein